MGNGGPHPTAGAGFVVCDAQLRVQVQGAAWIAPPPETPNTNNVAEFTALIFGLHAVLDCQPPATHSTKPKVVVVGDSQLVINHLHGRCQVQAPGLQQLARAATELTQSIDARFFWTARTGNARADALATEAISRQSSFIWKGDDWTQASRDWRDQGRTQPVSVTCPLRLLHGVIYPPLTRPQPTHQQPAATTPTPLTTSHNQGRGGPPPLLAHDPDWVVSQLTDKWTNCTPPPGAGTPTLNQLRTILVSFLPLVTVDLQDLLAYPDGLVCKWALSQCTFSPPRSQEASPHHRVHVSQGKEGFFSFWLKTVLAISEARVRRARQPPDYSLATDNGTGPPFPNRSWINPRLVNGNRQSSSSPMTPMAPAQQTPSQPVQGAGQVPTPAQPLVPHAAVPPVTGPPAPCSRGRVPRPPTRASSTTTTPTQGTVPTTLSTKRDQTWRSPASGTKRCRASPAGDTTTSSTLPSLITPNPFAPLSTEGVDHSERHRHPPQSSLSPVRGPGRNPSLDNTTTQPRNNQRSDQQRTSGKRGCTDGERQQHTDSCPNREAGSGRRPDNNPLSHRERTGSARRGGRRKEQARQRASHDQGRTTTPFLRVRGAPYRASPRAVLRDLRDVYGLPIPPRTEAYRGPRGQLVLHFPSTLAAREAHEGQERWLGISDTYYLQPFDPRATYLARADRRAWIREMRRARGTDKVFSRV